MEMNYDEKVRIHATNHHSSRKLKEMQTLQELELELDYQIVPGTEVMRDVGSHHFVKSSAESGNVLVPQPSDDPHDPLVGLSTYLV